MIKMSAFLIYLTVRAKLNFFLIKVFFINITNVKAFYFPKVYNFYF